jgi:uncharacterized heparinase superfamily protein
MTGPLSFNFLGESRTIAADGWSPLDASMLWRYNLHYFDDLTADSAAMRTSWHAQALDAWTAANRPASAPGWDPYPTSLRIVNWIKWAYAGNAVPRIACDSLAAQLDWLARRLEFHLGGNHLFANAKALVFGGAFLEGSDARRWLERGLEIIEEELPRQVLPDGGHFERSTMYHALALEDMLDLVNLARAHPALLPQAASFEEISRRMSRWLDAMCHPDGEISFFNDGALGVAPSPGELERYAHDLLGPTRRVGGSCRLEDSGYVRIECLDAVLLADVAPIGPDELPGHAHADTLSFELSLFGERVIVNGGTSRYGEDEARLRERGTRAHSTVEVDGENSSEVWSGFRVARRARPLEAAMRKVGEETILTAAHDGYQRLPGSPTHRRRWAMSARGVSVTDVVEGRFRKAVARFHLKPGVGCEIDGTGRAGVLVLTSGRRIRWIAQANDVRLEDSSYSPRFGVRLATRCIALEMSPSDETIFKLVW